MKSIADELTLVQSPVNDEDLLIHISGQLGEEFGPMVAALKARDSPISYPELFEKLVDFERTLKESAPPPPVMATVNFTQKQGRFSNFRSGPEPSRNSRLGPESSHQRRYQTGSFYSKQNRNQGPNYNGSNHVTRNSFYCYYCNIAGHETKDCRKLARFLKDNNVTIAPRGHNAPVANV
ncbi:putative transcription factor interactor and regulator CCHC(Zn) family [Helianthus annuus]|uniref:Transcription factor interactor and regulator CCHC(Zn) family n=1 Tax=Helianthus annuus TaxID=4232 RepID=A0A9K3J6R9_HELAN|nr:putative transcription factor interactor and regulator CCHC(Zn) family [Helianthus annuus]KAJ0580023.1 putative transcription factor interactor and regulator CCHC(Zn) family [Helianthus annuus]KAJ0595937.1 putative transcription factor interactor and regulator CCHC(Zn) family [Helianthus annuus]